MTDNTSHRRERVATAIKQQLAEAFMTRVKDPRIEMTSITRVDVSADLSHATVYISVLGEDADRDAALEGLESARGFLRSLLAKSLRLRTTPELHFSYDKGLDHASRMYQILDEIKKEEDVN